MNQFERYLYSMTEAGEAIGVRRSTVYELVARGELTTVKIGRRRLVTAESLRAFVDRQVGTQREGAGR